MENTSMTITKRNGCRTERAEQRDDNMDYPENKQPLCGRQSGQCIYVDKLLKHMKKHSVLFYL